MTYITTEFHLDLSKLVLLIIVIGICIYSAYNVVLKFRMIKKGTASPFDKVFFIIFIIGMIITAFLAVVFLVEIMSPVMYFSFDKPMTFEEAKAFTKKYAILENVGNIYKVKLKEVFV